MSEAGIRLTKESVTQTLNLNDLVGEDISEDQVLVKRITQGIIDYIEIRSEDGLGLNRVKLKSPYSKEYAESIDFKAAGKSKNHVNMRLTGSMLASIDVIEEDGAKVTYGIAGEDAPKAYNHQTGDTVPRRPFFGITKDEFKKYIMPEFKDEIQAKKVTSTESQNRLINEIRGIRTLADLFNL